MKDAMQPLEAARYWWARLQRQAMAALRKAEAMEVEADRLLAEANKLREASLWVGL